MLIPLRWMFYAEVEAVEAEVEAEARLLYEGPALAMEAVPAAAVLEPVAAAAALEEVT